MKTITPESAKELIDSLADKELSFGCEVVEISHKKNHKISWVNKEKETYGLNGIGGAFEMKDRDIDIEILGHPILIGNILEKMDDIDKGNTIDNVEMLLTLMAHWQDLGLSLSLHEILAEGTEMKIPAEDGRIRITGTPDEKTLKPEVAELFLFIKSLKL